MRFHSAMATLEPQKCVRAGTFGTENILLVSGRLDSKRTQKELRLNIFNFVICLFGIYYEIRKHTFYTHFPFLAS